ncbi:MAG: heparinase II/III family protein [Oligoflexia bacterium]|nr:heparinase II/III family protein [Oligoflexia bacterium]
MGISRSLHRNILLLAALVSPTLALAKTPAWGPDEHPRLLATAAEKPALSAKLNAPNTLAHAIWSDFLGSYRRSGSSFDYSDGAVVYWITGDTAAADHAIFNAQSFISAYPNGMTHTSYAYPDYPVDWWRYHNLVVTFDFAYARLSASQRTQFRDFIAHQGVVCSSLGPSWGPGNIDMAFALCALSSAIALEGYDASRDISNEVIVRGGSTSPAANTGDLTYYPIGISNLVVSSQPNGGGILYRDGIDYIYRPSSTCYNRRCIDWSLTGAGAVEPSPGDTYYVSYHWNADLAQWKNEGRRALENHLSYAWRDGSYNGGLSPYGNLAASYIPYLFEMMKRDSGLDYSRNSDIKKAIDPYLYERLPGAVRRFNSINDSNSIYSSYNDALPYPMHGGYRSWLRPLIAWSTSAYANDSEGYGQRAFWLWAQSFRNSNGTITRTPDSDWREAFWINNTLAGSYPNTSLPVANWPKHRYFRGKELVYSRSADWGSSDPMALVASFVAGPHNYQNEHDQGDSGSFTFFDTGEEWAIDPGYNVVGVGGDSIVDHNGLGIDGHGFEAAGVYGESGANPVYGGFSHFDAVVLTDGASMLKAELSAAWSLTSTPYVDHHQRYFSLIRGNKPAYLIVADDIKKDANTHSFEWYLHTGRNNTVTTATGRATINGSKTGAKLLVQTLSPAAVSLDVADSNAGQAGTHKRLRVVSSGVQNPNFLNVLIPSEAGQQAPTVSSIPLANGVQGTIVWPDGTSDMILWRTGSGQISGGGVSSDAKLTVVRIAAGVPIGLAVSDGRSVSFNGSALLTVLDGAKPVSLAAFGPTIGVAGEDATALAVRIPGISALTLEDGSVGAPISVNADVATINLPFSLSEVRRGGGTRFAENFDDNYPDSFFRYNSEGGSPEKFLVKGGALELSPSLGTEWMTITRRDSTPWRRADIFPSVIPALEHSDAMLSFRFKFAQNSAATRKLRFYFRTKYRDANDWSTNQDYVRVELNARENGVVKNLVALGQRVNGNLSGPEGNDTLTNQVASGPVSIDDTNWHNLSIVAQGAQVKVSVDGNQLIDAPLPVGAPLAPVSGFLQFRTIGSDAVLLDDLLVQAISTKAPDHQPPAAPGFLRIGS